MQHRTVATGIAAGLLLAGGGTTAASIASDHATHVPGPAAHARRAPDGVVVGRFEREGGPLGPGGTQPPTLPLSGTIWFARAGHRTVTVRAGKSGKFSVRLAPGSYRVSGRTPMIQGQPGNTDAVCSLPSPVRVTAHHARHITVFCIVP